MPFCPFSRRRPRSGVSPARRRPPRNIEIGTEAYANSQEHLLDELKLADLLIQAEVERWRAAGPAGQPSETRGLPYVSDAEADHIQSVALLGLGDGTTAGLMQPFYNLYFRLREQVDVRIARTASDILRLPHIQRIFGLTNGEVTTLLLALAPEWDPAYQRLYGYLQDDATRVHPSVGLLARMVYHNSRVAVGASAEEAASALLAGYASLTSQAPLRRYGLIEAGNASAPLAGQEVKVSGRLASFLSVPDGLNVLQRVDQRIAHCASIEALATEWDGLVLPEGLLARLRNLSQAVQDGQRVQSRTVAFVGPPGAGQLEAAQTVVADLSLNLLVVDAPRCLQSFSQDIPALLQREALLQNAALYIQNLESPEDDARGVSSDRQAFLDGLRHFPGLVFLEAQDPWGYRSGGYEPAHTFLFPLPGYALRQRTWTRSLEGIDLRLGDGQPLSALIDELANQFILTGTQIQQAVDIAVNRARLSGSPPRPSREDLWYGAQQMAVQRLIHFAQKLTPRHTWNQLVLPPASKRHLQELSDRIRYRSRVYSDANLQSRVSLGRGLLVLFTGPSGTGKTMAAEVIAGAQGMDLYKIDLSAVVSKYIGETEKNLNRIFQDAEASNAILFFDEADALFGKRSEVKDAHDRYANIEINYLLQRIEEFDGAVVLASNLRQNMDEAFLRRINIIVEFPFPSTEARLEIWRGMFPSGIVLEPDVDLVEISTRFRLSGGNIRNAAVDAAFRAAAEDGAGGPLRLRWNHLILAIGREYQKLGRPITKGEFGVDNHRFLEDYLYDGQEA